MTCHQAVPLLDDYLDGELSPQQVADLERHLADCPACTSELESGKKLRDLLKQTRDASTPPEPGADYWSESEALIYARTVESSRSAELERTTITSITHNRPTGALVRSMMLFAASFVLMIGAIYLGSKRQELSGVTIHSETPVLLAGSINQTFGSDKGLVLTKEEKNSLVRSMFALGAPGPVGRYTTMDDMLGSY
ncbi:MAG: zf-HC2 domain-containing protein [bacterium]|nr:zf-HC2 domain-containing protein [bacterium]